MTIRMFPPDGWERYRERRQAIAELLDPRCYSIDWLDLRILDGAARVFANDEAVIVTELREYPSGAREIHGLVAAGDLAAILTLIDQAEAWGREQELDFATIASREGWQRVLSSRGYAPHQIELRKDL